MGRATTLLAGVCVFSVFLYGIFLLEAVIHTASRQTAERQTQELSGKLSVLETQYLEQTQALTPARAAALGYVKPSSVAVVSSGSPSRALSLR
jgi:hypothetical protein